MKFFTNLISTTFFCDIKSNKNVMEIAEFVVQTFAFKIKKQEKDKLTLVPFWLSFFFPHPNFLVMQSNFKYNKEKQTIEFKVWHPFHLVISIIILYFTLLEGNSMIILIAPIILCYFLVYTIINQRMIMKNIIKEIEKEL